MSLLAAVPIISKALDLIFPDPKIAMEHKIAVLKLEQDGAFRQLDADVSLALAQIAVNQEEAKSESLLKSGWRPMVGWTCVAGLAYQFLLMPLLPWTVKLLGADVPPLPAIDMDTLMVLLTGLLGFGGMRTFEKVKKAT
jgi:hypothetical protein